MSKDLETYTMTLQEERDYYCKCMTGLQEQLEKKDKIINEQALEISRLKEWKEDLLNENIELENIRKEAIKYIKDNKDNTYQTLDFENGKSYNSALLELLEILEGDKENENNNI